MSAKSHHKVVVRCVECSQLFERKRRNVVARPACASCCASRRVPPGMQHIDKEETLRRFGYEAASLSLRASHPVIVRCSKCTELYSITRAQVIDRPPVCRPCTYTKAEFNPHIDEAETLRRFGYEVSALSAKTRKRVVVRCVECRALFERNRGRVTAAPVCVPCGYTHKPEVNPHIDDAETLRRFGYVGSELTRKSPKRVVVRCVLCEELFERVRGNVDAEPHCTACCYSPPVDHPQFDDAETLARFGYKVSTTARGSSRVVVVRCAHCAELFERRRVDAHQEVMVCQPCSRLICDVNPEKRKETILERYGEEGIPPFTGPYGQAEEAMCQRIEELLGRELTRQVPLASGKIVDMYDAVSGIAVEYNGLYWHNELSSAARGFRYHRDKQRACEAQGMSLVTVFEDEWKTRQEAVENVILSRMGAVAATFGARKCDLQPVDPRVASVFLARHHVQGAPTSMWAAWGLYVVNRLLAVITVGPHHRQGHEQTAVLSRLCFPRGIQVTGGAKRLFKQVLACARERRCDRLVSWSDNRWFSGTVYPWLGFSLAEELPPDYTYVVLNKACTRVSKQSQRKSVTGCPAGMTEHEWALERGLARIWDCGKKRWEMAL